MANFPNCCPTRDAFRLWVKDRKSGRWNLMSEGHGRSLLKKMAPVILARDDTVVAVKVVDIRAKKTVLYLALPVVLGGLYRREDSE
jgi:hypothetical protein